MELRSARKQANGKKRNWLIKLNWMLFVIQVGLIAYLGFIVVKNGILRLNRLGFIVIGAVVFVLLVQMALNFTKKAKIFNMLLTLLLCGSLAYGTVKLHDFIGLFDKISDTQNVSEYTMSVVVLKDSDITSLEQLAGVKVDAPTAFDKDNITALVDKIKKDKNITLDLEDVSSYYQAYIDLLSGEAKAIILNSSFESILENQYPDLSDKIRKIYEFKQQKVFTQKTTTAATDQKTDIFNIYLSGVDTFGSIAEVSRSDVNIIATVNRKTRQILLTSTPRDAYVRIADGGNNQYDKLTHAGVYGIDTSMHTLENLYGIKTDYFLRLNFSTFMEMVDIIGGVEVDNEFGFQSYADPRLYFKAGKQTLSAYDALFYVRERYNLPDGDVGRARHQAQVIKAILNKLLSPLLLTNSTQIVQQLAQSSQTNIHLETIMYLLNDYIEDTSKPYNIQFQALAVEGKVGLKSYALPNASLWMGVVQEDSLKAVKENMQRVMNGEAPVIIEDESP